MAVKSILNTPYDLQEVAKSFFSCPRIQREQADPLVVSLQLAPNLPPLRLTTAVRGDAFVWAIQELSINKVLAKQNGEAPPPLDPTRFSLDVPLTNWAKFERALYEQNGSRCQEDIKTYLQGIIFEPFPDRLVSLGLDPGQVENGAKEEVATYFENVIPQLSVAALANFHARYPQMARYLAEKVAREDLGKPSINNDYPALLEHLQSQVSGQRFAAQTIASILSRKGADENSVFLFIGPAGVGKTELAKAAATHKNDQMISFPMNQFSDEHAVTTLFGSPASYIGSTSKPQLALELEKYPNAVNATDPENIVIRNLVILLDEFEKAHSTVRRSFLTLFVEGCCTTRYTIRTGDENTAVNYILRGCIIIATSNLFQEDVLQAFQRGKSIEEAQAAFKVGNRLLRQFNRVNYSDELLGCMQIVPFAPISRGDEYQKILRQKVVPFLQKLQTDLGCRKVEIENRDLFFSCLENKLYEEGVDLRRTTLYLENLRGTIDRNISSWGDIRNKKIVLYEEREQVFVKLFTFVDLYDDYVLTPIEPIKVHHDG